MSVLREYSSNMNSWLFSISILPICTASAAWYPGLKPKCSSPRLSNTCWQCPKRRCSYNFYSDESNDIGLNKVTLLASSLWESNIIRNTSKKSSTLFPWSRSVYNSASLCRLTRAIAQTMDASMPSRPALPCWSLRTALSISSAVKLIVLLGILDHCGNSEPSSKISLYKYKCTHVYLYMYMCRYIISMYIGVPMHVYVCVDVYIYICKTYVRHIRTDVYRCKDACMYVSMYSCIHVNIYTKLYMYTHVNA